MNQKTIIFCGRDDLLSHSVEFFLSSNKEWNVIRIYDQCSLGSLLETIDNVNPNVVILHQDACSGNTNLPAHLVKDHAGLKVITVSLEDNSMEVYNKQKVWINKAEDLLSIIE